MIEKDIFTLTTFKTACTSEQLTLYAQPSQMCRGPGAPRQFSTIVPLSGPVKVLLLPSASCHPWMHEPIWALVVVKHFNQLHARVTMRCIHWLPTGIDVVSWLPITTGVALALSISDMASLKYFRVACVTLSTSSIIKATVTYW